MRVASLDMRIPCRETLVLSREKRDKTCTTYFRAILYHLFMFPPACSFVVVLFLFSAEVDQEFNPPPPTVEYLSTTKKDFSKGWCTAWEMGGVGLVGGGNGRSGVGGRVELLTQKICCTLST